MSIRLSETSSNGLMPEHFTGEVILPGDRDYESARRVWNGMIDRKPRAVLRARTAGDIEPAVTMAARHGLPLAIRGGGHSVAGHGDADGPGPVYGPGAGARLAALKRQYDPANLFRVNHNIPAR